MKHKDAYISIAVSKEGVPAGTVLLDDVASLTKGLSDAVARIIQHNLGYPDRVRPSDEVKKLARIVLSGVFEGSGVLQFSPFPAEGAVERAPSIVAASDLIRGINHFGKTADWPLYFPATVRNRFAAAIAPVLTDHARLELSVADEKRKESCFIDRATKAALQEPEIFKTSKPIQLVGKIFDINIETKSFKVNTKPKKIAVRIESGLSDTVDDLRWKRVFVAGYPEDEGCRAVNRILEIRSADDGEVDGIILPEELKPAESTLAYQEILQRTGTIRGLKSGWDSYSGEPPGDDMLDYSLVFFRQMVAVLLNHGIEPPVPFLTPTPLGGIQYEWQADDRELELEIVSQDTFQYLRVSGSEEMEGAASRWEAIRLIRWLATGEAA